MTYTPESIVARCQSMLDLKEGWMDGEGLLISPKAIDLCQDVFLAMDQKHHHDCGMFPNLDGGCQIEWFGSDWFFDAEFYEDVYIVGNYRNIRTKRSFEYSIASDQGAANIARTLEYFMDQARP